MKTLLVATTNSGKVFELKQFLGKHCAVLNPKDPAFSSISAPQVIEDADSYYEHGLRKALAYFQVYKQPVLSDDSGIEIDGLGGKPGVHSAYFGGQNISWEERWQAIWKELQQKTAQNQADQTDQAKNKNSQTKKALSLARFRTVLCFYDGVSPPLFFEGISEGEILSQAIGKNGFGYDPIFFCRDLQKTFGEVSIEEKNQYSARGRACKSFLDWFLLPAKGE